MTDTALIFSAVPAFCFLVIVTVEVYVISNPNDDLVSAVRYALITTRAIAACPFHESVTIRVGDDAQERHAFLRARNIVKSDGSSWEPQILHQEIERQLNQAADGTCPECEAIAKT